MWQVGSTCYTSKASALGAAASTQTGAVVSHGGSSATVSVGPITDSSITYVFSPIDGSAAFSQVVSMDPQPCALLDTSDALQLSWMVGAAWLVAWGMRMLGRSMWAQLGGSDDT